MFRGSDLAAAVRWYRSSVNRHGEPPESNEFAALPVSVFLHSEEDGDDANRFLQFRMRSRRHRQVRSPSAPLIYVPPGPNRHAALGG
jgi:hypothetical protein